MCSSKHLMSVCLLSQTDHVRSVCQVRLSGPSVRSVCQRLHLFLCRVSCTCALTALCERNHSYWFPASRSVCGKTKREIKWKPPEPQSRILDSLSLFLSSASLSIRHVADQKCLCDPEWCSIITLVCTSAESRFPSLGRQLMCLRCVQVQLLMLVWLHLCKASSLQPHL